MTNEEQLTECQKEIFRLRGIVRCYGSCLDEIEEICQSDKNSDDKISSIITELKNI